MPKSQTSLTSRVLAFFRKAPMEVAETILDLAREAVRERKAHSETIRAAQETARRRAAGKKAAQVRSKQVAKVAKVAKPATAKVAAPKVGKRKKKPAHRQSTNGSGNRIPPPPTDEEGASLPLADDEG